MQLLKKLSAIYAVWILISFWYSSYLTKVVTLRAYLHVRCSVLSEVSCHFTEGFGIGWDPLQLYEFSLLSNHWSFKIKECDMLQLNHDDYWLLCNLVDVCRHFRGMCCMNLQCTTTERSQYIPLKQQKTSTGLPKGVPSQKKNSYHPCSCWTLLQAQQCNCYNCRAVLKP